ncbi:MAG TPA: lytic transglycosylase domain-containing protein [bacterium]|nr:lytic transglycosylase domain-containing protein [bacterium]HPS29067.1 lytic transglycosylase domain-containing protein [bacterium]
MSRFAVFIFIFSISAGIYGYPECMNDEKISEQCMKEVYKSGDFNLILGNIEKSTFKNMAHGLAIKIDVLYKSGRYDELEKSINSLPSNLKNSLYYRVLLMKSMFARKRFNQTVDMLDSIKENFPVYYLYSGIDCIRGDIFLYRKKYDSALEIYDRCTAEKTSVFASYNRILALEKESVAKNALFEEYIGFAEKFEGSVLMPEIIKRFVYLREKGGYPGAASPYYSRWLAIMRKSSVFDRIFNDDFMKLSSPAVFEIIKYLISKNRYGDALNIVERELVRKDIDIDLKFQLVNEKFKILNLLNQPEKASEFALNIAIEFPETKKDKLEFFAGLNYFDSGFAENGRAILERIVLNDQESKYFLTALYKLGLIYLSEGSQLYTFTLWSNYIFDSSFSASKYHGGTRLLNDMLELAALIDRLNNFCLLSSDIDFDCGSEEVCSPEINKQFISYYDFAYYSLINRNEFKTKPDHSNNSFVEKWRKNRVELSVDESPVLEKMNLLPKKIKNNEYVVMIDYFLNSGVRDGALFYLDAMNMILKFNGDPNTFVKVPDKEVIDPLKTEIADFKLKMNGVLIRYLGKTGDIADSNYNAVSQDLTFSPHYGKADEWRSIYPTPYFEDIMKLSVEFDIPPQLIYSIMRAETFYRDNLVSPVGALGLMQVMPDTFEKISKYGGIKIKDPFNPYESMKASAWYLSKLLKRFDGSYIAAIAAYNAGPHRVTEWVKKYKGMDNYLFIEMIPYQETRNYVKKVLRYFLIYSYLYEGTFCDVGLNGVVDIEEQPDIVNF